MKKVFNLAGMLVLIHCLGACSTINTKELAAGGLGELSNSQISYSPAQCKVVKDRCISGYYSEWPTSDGKTGCSCQN